MDKTKLSLEILTPILVTRFSLRCAHMQSKVIFLNLNCLFYFVTVKGRNDSMVSCYLSSALQSFLAENILKIIYYLTLHLFHRVRIVFSGCRIIE